ncbi:DUF7167 family protein [Listeria booriae]|uniref:DUF7167 family protein n=1 Tax=Listeria booriae TaxID=1552123 RepID=UPI0016267AC0|nr:hypothetical protein [Listeria booriae]MBC1286925.1 hypothetical protein [Listeria booriae]MBC1306836.1 hypothetical protein [Listeria booriae]
MRDKKVRFYVATDKVGSAITECFYLKAELDIEFDKLTPEELDSEIAEAYDNWLGSNIDSGWSIEDEVSE